MSAVFDIADISKQAHHQMLQRLERELELQPLIIRLIEEVREMHPGMGLRTIYEITQPKEIGRDGFMSIGAVAGLMLDPVRNKVRTTFSIRCRKYKNLLKEKIFTDINQLWVTDITYFIVEPVVYYLVFIMDAYSRRIIGHCASDNMRAENNLAALTIAVDMRRIHLYEDLIHHSDKGSQYTSDDYLGMLNDCNIKVSMCESALENAHIERVHGTIKNQYLNYWDNDSLKQLRKNLDRAVNTYNQRPHQSLNGISPIEYEKLIEQQSITERKQMKIFVSENFNKHKEPSDQLVLSF